MPRPSTIRWGSCEIASRSRSIRAMRSPSTSTSASNGSAPLPSSTRTLVNIVVAISISPDAGCAAHAANPCARITRCDLCRDTAEEFGRPLVRWNHAIPRVGIKPGEPGDRVGIAFFQPIEPDGHPVRRAQLDVRRALAAREAWHLAQHDPAAERRL
jgi:hypothetical protein